MSIPRRIAIAAVLGMAWLFPSCSHALRGTVQRESSGSALAFIVFYTSWERLLNDYGPGVDEVRARLKDTGYVDAEATWDKAFEESVPRFLRATQLVPAECGGETTVYQSEEAEGGGGWARFRCE
jgi:hypothetical protein